MFKIEQFLPRCHILLFMQEIGKQSKKNTRFSRTFSRQLIRYLTLKIKLDTI